MIGRPPRKTTQRSAEPCLRTRVGASCRTVQHGNPQHEALQREDNGRLIASRRQSAIQRISQTGMFLQSQGLIKKIRKEDVRREIPAAWLLLIGDDEENREVEAYARECLGLSLLLTLNI